MPSIRRQSGNAFILLALLVFAVTAAAIVLEAAAPRGQADRRRETERSLAEAREALIAYAADRPVSTLVGPGYLPCPDLDNDGWAEATCGSLDGSSGQEQRLGRLPWKTLGLPDLRDGDGERLWYAVSSKHKGLLNCAASAACVDMSPDAALGTITVRDAGGALLHDGTIAEAYRAREGGAAAVVIAPGAPLARLSGEASPGVPQVRECGADCDDHGRCLTDPPQRAATCDPRNYLDRAPGARFHDEDNAAFVDRNDTAGRAMNVDGFIAGPVRTADGGIAVNDRIVAIGYGDLMPRVMRRVAIEAAQCLRTHAAAASYPWAAPACAQAAGGASAWMPAEGVRFGRIPDVAWAATCNLSSASAHSWWKAWRANVFYALAPSYAPSAGAMPSCAASGSCVEIVQPDGRVVARGRHAAVIVAGAPLVREGFLQHHDAASLGDVRQYLEDGNAQLEGGTACGSAAPFDCEAAGTCGRVTAAAPSRTFNDVAVAIP